jgi:GntR family transcriptional regulator, transcriptional repressor for pyruvate dehydrogenase complex
VSVVVPAPAYKILADDLRARITSGLLRPGDRLPTEPQLCQSCGVSRSTVREALRLLASQNLIVTTRGVAGGSFVAHPSPAQLSDTLATGLELMLASAVVTIGELLEIRRMLDVPAAGLAAQRRTDEHLRVLHKNLLDPETAVVDALIAANQSFHLALAEASGNRLFAVLTRPLYVLSNRALGEAVDRQVWQHLDDDHRQILAAIEARDVAVAEAAAACHIDRMRRVVEDLDPQRLDDEVSASGGA